MLSPGRLLRPLASSVVVSLAFAAPAAASPFGRLELLGEAILASGLEFHGTEVGGLSGLTYDPAADRFLALSDDPSATDPARLYSLSIDLADGRLETGDVEIEAVTTLSDRDGRPFTRFAIDGEGLAPAPANGLFLSSEGNVRRGVEPFIREIDRAGTWRRDLDLPRRFRSRRDGAAGVRHNLAFEGLTVSPGGRWLFVGVENALAQDGPTADVDRRSPARILRYDARRGRPVADYLYWVDPVPEPPTAADGFRINGLVELLALDDDTLLALERSYAAGVGNGIRLYAVDLRGAQRLGRRPLGRRAARVRAARKTLLLDFAQLGIELENLEALCFGPRLADGRRTLVAAADNNFSPRQRTQFLAFAWETATPSIPRIQGRAHRSPLEGQWVWGVEGVVTAVDPDRDRGGVWVQDPAGDADRSTSDGLFVAWPAAAALAAGDRVAAHGRVREDGRPGDLSVTRLEAASVAVLATGAALPPTVELAALPSAVDDDGLTLFEPEDDAIDHLESLEGMRVALPAPVAVGPTTRYGDFVVLPDGAADAGPRTGRGGLRLSDASPFRRQLQVDPRLLAAPGRRPAISVGSRFDGPIVGVLDYAFGAYEVVASEPLPAAAAAAVTLEPTSVRGDAGALTIATYNVENLDAHDPDEKVARLARSIAHHLAAPDVLALQEIQDDSGPEDDGVVSAVGTFTRLVEAIVAGGGPRYDFRQIDPADAADGGQPGGNIRVGFLFNPSRVAVAERGAGDALTAAVVAASDDGWRLVPNPGRVAPAAPAFSADASRGYQPSRKPLALEIAFGGRQLLLVNAHLRSKRGDDGLFGSVQPPMRSTEAQRIDQARELRRLVEDALAADPAAAVVVLGDLNEHEFRPPLAELTGDVLVNLVGEVSEDERYTYVYRGVSQVLDHILVSRELAERAAPRVDIVHVNADAPASARASDHDPVVVRLELAPRPAN